MKLVTRASWTFPSGSLQPKYREPQPTNAMNMAIEIPPTMQTSHRRRSVTAAREWPDQAKQRVKLAPVREAGHRGGTLQSDRRIHEGARVHHPQARGPRPPGQ